jgi:diketogulonate reductase-like aldo/keto reductase
MPVLGLGVWAASGKPCVEAVKHALRVGYRLIDTAKVYGNEKEVGLAVRESGIPREDIFVTTKVWSSDQGYESTLRALDASLERLGMEYVDLYLIHWPGSKKRGDTWRALLELRDRGKTRAIGVSNYYERHLQEVLDASSVVPAVDQIELSPFLHPRQVAEFCRQRGIVVEAYSPLTRGERLKDRALVAIAEKYGKSPAQIALRWSLQHGYVVIPKSVHPPRIEENADVFDFMLAPADMEALDGLHDGFRTCWDPSEVP